jgi:hypothetical protein
MGFLERRTGRKAVVSLLLLALLAYETARPRPARAVDTAVIVVSAIAGYVAFILAGTWLVYTRKQPKQRAFLPEKPLPEKDERERLHLGPECRTADGTMPVLCW